MITLDHQIDLVSKAYGIEGDAVSVFVRERVLADAVGTGQSRPVVLFLHGGTYAAVADFDLPYKDYSWMTFLAEAGFHVFIMDCVGYGRSSKPALDDPRNLVAEQREILRWPAVKDVPAARLPSRHDVLRSPQSEWADMHAVMAFIRKQTRAGRVSLIGWSGGGPRAGGYAALHPEGIDKLILLAPAYARGTPDIPLDAPGMAGAPLRITTRAAFEAKWDRQTRTAEQRDPAIRDVVWAVNMESDPIGASWDPPVLRGPNLSMASITRGWNENMAAKVTAPTLLMTAEWDADVPPPVVRSLYEDLGSNDKMLVSIKGASHYIPWENHHRVVHELSAQWLRSGNLVGLSRGEMVVNPRGDG